MCVCVCVCLQVLRNERDTFWESNSRHQGEINTKMSLIFQITSDLILWTRTSQIYLLFRLINDYCISYQRVNFSVIITDYTPTISSVCVSTMWTFPKNLRILEKCFKYFLRVITSKFARQSKAAFFYSIPFFSLLLNSFSTIFNSIPKNPFSYFRNRCTMFLIIRSFSWTKYRILIRTKLTMHFNGNGRWNRLTDIVVGCLTNKHSVEISPWKLLYY